MTKKTAKELDMTEGAFRAFQHYRRQAITGFVILAAGLGVATWANQDANEQAREDVAKASIQADRAIVKSGRTVSVAGCNRDFQTINALRQQIKVALKRIDRLEANGTYSHALADASRKAQRQFLREYPLPDCREALEIV